MGLAWRVVDTGANCGAYNMGVDQVLAAAAAQSPVLRFYGWDPPAVSCGWNQQPERETNVEACRALGIDVVRRPTGGRAVLHWRIDLQHRLHCGGIGLRWRDRSYAPQDGACLAEGLRFFGAPVELERAGRCGEVSRSGPVLAARRAGSSSASSASWSAARSGATDVACCNTGRFCSAGRTSACPNLFGLTRTRGKNGPGRYERTARICSLAWVGPSTGSSWSIAWSRALGVNSAQKCTGARWPTMRCAALVPGKRIAHDRAGSRVRSSRLADLLPHGRGRRPRRRWGVVCGGAGPDAGAGRRKRLRQERQCLLDYALGARSAGPH